MYSNSSRHNNPHPQQKQLSSRPEFTIVYFQQVADATRPIHDVREVSYPHHTRWPCVYFAMYCNCNDRQRHIRYD